MRIGVYGCGYIGSVLAGCLADFGVPVSAYDPDLSKLEQLAAGGSPYHEKNLPDVVKRNLRAGRLVMAGELSNFVARANVIFLAEDSDREIESSALEIARHASRDTILVMVTPAAVGTARRIDNRLAGLNLRLPLVVQPLFLTDGCAIEDFNWPDRIVLGTASSEAVHALKQIYRPLAMRGVPVIVTNFETAELTRVASSAFLATKISLINEIAGVCERVNADAMDLALAVGLDKRIAPRCLQPGTTFGGSFAETDLESLVTLAANNNLPLKVLGAAREVNREVSERVIEKLAGVMESLAGKEVGLLGLSFKPNTNSVASSSSIRLARRLLAQGARVRAYDPVAIPKAKVELNGTVRYCESAYLAVEGADAVVVSTGWPEFRSLDFDRIRRIVKQPVIVDTKNLLDPTRLRALGFQYVGVGRA